MLVKQSTSFRWSSPPFFSGKGQSSSSSSETSGSSASSSSSSSCGCFVSIVLNPTCGLELSNGVVYAVGEQSIGAEIVSDPCNCLKRVEINGQYPTAVCVPDGAVVSVTPVWNDACCVCEGDGPHCFIQPFSFRMGRNGLRLVVNKQYIKEKLRSMRRRKVR